MDLELSGFRLDFLRCNHDLNPNARKSQVKSKPFISDKYRHLDSDVAYRAKTPIYDSRPPAID